MIVQFSSSFYIVQTLIYITADMRAFQVHIIAPQYH